MIEAGPELLDLLVGERKGAEQLMLKIVLRIINDRGHHRPDRLFILARPGRLSGGLLSQFHQGALGDPEICQFSVFHC